ncbi:hypothetical protein DL96DRAFT_899872 [Flagelloscypha sp. PMI_526]|nr:hypothetical protein DL96DRAFT_899872 [Flagelloscypha sp. PMI_526]
MRLFPALFFAGLVWFRHPQAKHILPPLAGRSSSEKDMMGKERTYLKAPSTAAPRIRSNFLVTSFLVELKLLLLQIVHSARLSLCGWAPFPRKRGWL